MPLLEVPIAETKSSLKYMKQYLYFNLAFANKNVHLMHKEAPSWLLNEDSEIVLFEKAK